MFASHLGGLCVCVCVPPSPTLCPEYPLIGSRLAVTLYRISAMGNVWKEKMRPRVVLDRRFSPCESQVGEISTLTPTLRNLRLHEHVAWQMVNGEDRVLVSIGGIKNG